MTDVRDSLEEYRGTREAVETALLPLATSVDGRRFGFQVSLHGLELEPGGYVVIEGKGSTRLGQLLSLELRQQDTTAPGLRAGPHPSCVRGRRRARRRRAARSTTRSCDPRPPRRWPPGSSGTRPDRARLESASSRSPPACRSRSTPAGLADTRSCAASRVRARPTRSACCSSAVDGDQPEDRRARPELGLRAPRRAERWTTSERYRTRRVGRRSEAERAAPTP